MHRRVEREATCRARSGEKEKVPMFWKARDLEKMGERVAKKMGVETRELKKMSFSGEIKSNVKVTSISAEQRQSAREAKVEKSPTPKSGAKKVSFAKELLDHAPRSKVHMTQKAYDLGNLGQGKKRVMPLSKGTMEQAARELGQVAARHGKDFVWAHGVEVRPSSFL